MQVKDRLRYPETLKHTNSGRHLLPFLGLACGASVATIYYNQPLLLEISRSFGVSPATGGAVSVATQLGYAAGILFFVPLGDGADRRKLILRLFAADAASLVAAALAPTFWSLVAVSVAIGMTAGVTHLMVPMAPELAEPGESGRAIGTVMTGLLAGVLLGRAVSGALSEIAGWRGVFLIAAVFTGGFVPVLAWRLPASKPKGGLPYGAALRSLWRLAREQPVLRQASAISFLSFAAFISFWTNLPFLLGSPRYGLGAAVAGSFGLVGVAGATMAGPVGRFADRRGAHAARTVSLALLTVGFAVLWAGGNSLAGLVGGVLVLDIGQQGLQVSNQTRIFSLIPEARSRINTVYMVVYFLGGAFGSAASAYGWSRWGWNGVCGFAMAMVAVAWWVHRW